MLVWHCTVMFLTYVCCQKWLLYVSLTTGTQRLAHPVAGELYARVRGGEGGRKKCKYCQIFASSFSSHWRDVTRLKLRLCQSLFLLGAYFEELVSFIWDTPHWSHTDACFLFKYSTPWSCLEFGVRPLVSGAGPVPCALPTNKHKPHQSPQNQPQTTGTLLDCTGHHYCHSSPARGPILLFNIGSLLSLSLFTDRSVCLEVW